MLPLMSASAGIGLGLLGPALPSPVSFNRASTAAQFGITGALTAVGINVARFDYDPSTLAPNGLLIEPQIGEKIANSALTGAVPGTPGTLPSGVNNTLIGLSQQVVGTGTEDGIPYIDVRFFGTTSGTAFGLSFGAITDAPASNGQTWTGSIFHRLVGGTLTNITGAYLFQFEYNNVLAFLNSPSVACANPTSAPLRTQRQIATIAHSQASLAYLLPLYYFLCGSGVAIDITIRIGAPGLAQVPGPYDPILTYGTQLTKAADQAYINLSAIPGLQTPQGFTFGGGFTLSQNNNGVPFGVSAGSFGSSIYSGCVGGNINLSTGGGVLTLPSPGTIIKFAVSVDALALTSTLSINGVVAAPALLTSVPIMTVLSILCDPWSQGNQPGGHATKVWMQSGPMTAAQLAQVST